MLSKFRFPHVVPCLALLVLAGCGPGKGSVSGKVTFKDKPLTGGSVSFLTSDQKVKSGIIQSDGSYTVEGVVAGPVKIGVVPPPPLPKMPAGMKMDPGKMGAPEGAGAAGAGAQAVNIPQKYQDPEKSGLTYTATTGKQQHNIDLK